MVDRFTGRVVGQQCVVGHRLTVKKKSPVTGLQEEVYNANFIRYEEKATNEESIKDVQDAQSNLTQAIQILTDFSSKVIQNDFARLESETTASESRSCTHF